MRPTWRLALRLAAITLVVAGAEVLFHHLTAGATAETNGATATAQGSCRSAWDQWQGSADERQDPLPGYGVGVITDRIDNEPGPTVTQGEIDDLSNRAVAGAVAQCKATALRNKHLALTFIAFATIVGGLSFVPARPGRRRTPIIAPTGRSPIPRS